VTSTAANLGIIDTSVYIDNRRPARFKRDLSMIWARTCESLHPTKPQWFESGSIVNRLVGAKGHDIHKTREIHFDVLIALTARRIAAYLITSNGADFRAINEFLDFKLICR
jgi:hypothetical protein